MRAKENFSLTILDTRNIVSETLV